MHNNVQQKCFCVLVLTLIVLFVTAWFPVLADISSVSTHVERNGNEVGTSMMKFPLIKRRSSLSSALSSTEDMMTTENLKGRPGQGYYIAILIGTPPQRVSFSSFFIIHSFNLCINWSTIFLFLFFIDQRFSWHWKQ